MVVGKEETPEEQTLHQQDGVGGFRGPMSLAEHSNPNRPSRVKVKSTFGAAAGKPSKVKMTKSSGKSSGGHYRSAISGRYVTNAHGKASPRTTVHESGKSSGSGKSGK